MSDGWPKMKLSEAGVILLDCDHKTPEAVDVGRPYIGIPQMTTGRIDFSTARQISEADFVTWNRKTKYQRNDVVLSRRTNPGVTAIDDTGTEFALGQNLVLLRANSKSVDPPFLRWLVRTPEWWEQIEKFMNVGAVFSSLRCRDVPSFELTIPPLREQLAIAATLGALDDKIELNRKMNATLEAMARALFRDWFVDFGPTRAKMEASAPPLSPDLWSLFPDRLDDAGKPEGWEERPVGDFAELKGGKQLEKEHIADAGPVPVFGGAGLMGYTTNHNADGFVISVGRVGAYCGQFFSHRGKAWINNNASLICPNADVPGEWLLSALRHIDMDVIKKGAAQPFVSNGDISKVGIVWPGHAIISAFSDVLVPLMRKAEANEHESRALAQTRDLLLPRLMSGELRVVEAESLARAVA